MVLASVWSNHKILYLYLSQDYRGAYEIYVKNEIYVKIWPDYQIYPSKFEINTVNLINVNHNNIIQIIWLND